MPCGTTLPLPCYSPGGRVVFAWCLKEVKLLSEALIGEKEAPDLDSHDICPAHRKISRTV